MINFSKKNLARRPNLKRSNATYESLEERKLLAVTAAFSGGELAVNLDAQMDVAVLSNDGTNVMVNGSLVDTDSKAPGIQAASISGVTELVFTGSKGVTDAAVSLQSSFNTGDLASLRFNNINQVDLVGDYVAGELLGNFVGNDGEFTGDGSITVTGRSQFNSADRFTVLLENPNNDFGGAIDADTDGLLRFVDQNDVVLEDVSVRWLIVVAEGSITDTVNSSIDVLVTTNLTADSINLGNNGAPVNARALVSNTVGDFSFNELDFFSWSNNSTVGSANISATTLITQGPFANILVQGDAIIESNEIRLGVGGTNTFNSGRLNINSDDSTFIWEDSSLELFGNNSAEDLDLIASGNITNAADASINVTEITSVQSTNGVFLGNADGDNFQTGFLEFFADIVNITEDSDTIISGLANFAGNLRIDSNGSITDTDEAFIFVQENATFISAVDEAMSTAGVVLGDTESDFFAAGNISFSVTDGDFAVEEDNNTTIASTGNFVNNASAINIVSAGSIGTPEGFSIDVETMARFEGENITIGLEDLSSVELGSILLVTPGNASIEQTGAMILTGTSTVGGDLDLVTDGFLGDSNTSNMTVGGRASLTAGSILIGDLDLPTIDEPLGDFFDSSTLHFNSAGNVDITQDGDILLAGNMSHRANELRLSAVGNDVDNGRIQNEVGADIRAQDNMFLTSLARIDLGVNPTDVLNFNNLNFNTPAQVVISAIFEDAEAGFFIFGTSNNPNTASDLTLVTNVDVMDGTDAVIDITNSLTISGRNIVLGDTDTDCLMIPDNAQFNTTDAAADITEDENCPV